MRLRRCYAGLADQPDDQRSQQLGRPRLIGPAAQDLAGHRFGRCAAAGLYLPESILAPDYYIGRMKEFCAQFRRA